MASQTKSKTVGHVAAFDLTSPVEDGEIVRYENALIFKSGEFPAKAFSMTPEELKAAAEAFTQPVPNELEHFSTSGTPTILDGNLGHVESVRLSEDGTELRGTVAIPKWLDKVWTGPTKQVSAVWDRATKRLQRLGLVVKGHVEGAALFGEVPAIAAAFSEATGTPVDPATLVAFTPRKRTPEATAHMQGIHDHLAALNPAVCGASFGDRPKQMKAYGRMHAYAVEHGAKCGPAAMSDDHHQCRCQAAGSIQMTAKDRLNARLGDKAGAFRDVTEEQAEALLAAFAEPAKAEPAKDEAAMFAETPAGKAMAAKIKALEDAREADRLSAARKDAALFSEDLTRSGHIVPANKAAFSELAFRLMQDDHATPEVVTFSHGGEPKSGGRVDALLAFVAGQPKAIHDRPVLGAIQDGTLKDRFALFAAEDPRPKDGTPTEADLDAALALYPGGSSLVAERRRARAGS